MVDFIYDVETYPNIFTLTVLNVGDGSISVYEISERRNDTEQLLAFIFWLQHDGARMIGFNNRGFDYPIVHFLANDLTYVNDATELNKWIYWKAQCIFTANQDEKFQHLIPTNQELVPQIDLYKIHHFDNNARATSLKKLEVNMRSMDVQDLPFEPGTFLTFEQMDELIKYNIHDVLETRKFYDITKPMIDFRVALSEKYRMNLMNHNDAKIGESYLINRLENDLGKNICFYKDENNRRQIRQTWRPQLHLADVILPCVKFYTPQFNAVLDFFNRQVITTTNGVFTEIPENDLCPVLRENCNMKKTKGLVKNLNCIVDGFQFDFGTGGIHGSIDSAAVVSDDEFVIIDLDVTSYYPSLAIVNGVYPEHLTAAFCEIYADVKAERMQYKKGSPENAMLKLALNGAYGKSNSIYSPFYDPKYTMTITINGQLLLCMLFEMLRGTLGNKMEMIQINTDGLTIRVPRIYEHVVDGVSRAWEGVTGLELEKAIYNRMFIRDVNNYIAEGDDGKIKRKGKYAHDVDFKKNNEWHKNFNSLVVQKAAENHLLWGGNIRQFIENHNDIFDFCLSTKVPRSSHLMWGEQRVQNVTRYFISKNGAALTKVMPPTPAQLRKDVNAPNRKIGINKGFNVQVMNTMRDVRKSEIDFDWYVAETEKITGVFYA